MIEGRCAETVYDGLWSQKHQCSRKSTLKYKGKLYCKQHHPPSIEARKTQGRFCTWQWSKGNLCNARLRKEDKGPWCRHCRRREADMRMAEKSLAYDRVMKLLDKLEQDGAGVLKFPMRVRRTMRLKGLQKP